MRSMKRAPWERMMGMKLDHRLAAANRGAIYVAGRTPVTVLHMGGRDLWNYVKRPINRILTNKNKVPMFLLDRQVKLQPGQAVVAVLG